MAFLYQQSESIAMDAVRDELKTLQISVLANVHDAIYLDQRLEPSQKDRIERTMRSNTGLDYWTLDEDIIKGYRDFKALMSTIPDVCTKVKLVSRPISEKHASTRSAGTGTWVRTTPRNAVISSATKEKGRTRRPLFLTSDRATTRS